MRDKERGNLRAIVLTLLMVGVGLAAGCLGGKHPSSADSAAGPLVVPPGGCDHPLLNERVRAREMDLASDPSDPKHLAVGLIVSLPSTRNQAPHDWPFWDGLARSDDGGATWTFATLPGWEGDVSEAVAPWVPSVFLSDPIVTFLHDGTLILSFLAVQPSAVSMYMLRYPPGAMEPESSSVVVRSALTTTAGAHLLPIGPPFTVYNDKQQVFEDPATGELFVTWFWRTDDPVAHVHAQPMLAKSTDGGRTWGAPVVVYDNGHYDDPNGGFNAGSWPFVTLDGNLHVIWWEDYTDKLFQVDSPDRGATFGAPRAIADAPTDFAQPNGIIQLGIPSIDIDRSTGPFRGSVYVAWEDRTNGDRDVFTLHSRDHAATWSAPVRVNDDAPKNGRDQFMPQLAVEPDGGVAVLFMDMRDDPAGQKFVATIGRSLDGGQTFSNAAVASVPSDVGVIGNSATDQPDPAGRTRLGDYVGIAPGPAGGLVAVWQDGREGTPAVPYSNAYVCRIAAG